MSDQIHAKWHEIPNSKGGVYVSNGQTLLSGTYIKYDNYTGSMTLTDAQGNIVVWRIASGVHSINNVTTWTMTGSLKTGSGSVSVPVGAKELCIKVNITLDIILTLHIPVAFLQATTQHYRSGYYQNGTNGGMASFACSTSTITLSNAYLNATAVTSTTDWVVYYR